MVNNFRDYDTLFYLLFKRSSFVIGIRIRQLSGGREKYVRITHGNFSSCEKAYFHLLIKFLNLSIKRKSLLSGHLMSRINRS